MCVCVCVCVCVAWLMQQDKIGRKPGASGAGREVALSVWQPWHLLPRINKSSQSRQLIHPSRVVPEAVMLKRGAKGLGNGWTRQGETQA